MGQAIVRNCSYHAKQRRWNRQGIKNLAQYFCSLELDLYAHKNIALFCRTLIATQRTICAINGGEFVNSKCIILLVAFIAVRYSAAQQEAKLYGIERVYFRPVLESDSNLMRQPNVASFLPIQLKSSDLGSNLNNSLDEIAVRDFRLPFDPHGKELWIREIVNSEHHRIFETWWAMYAGGKRSCLWRFRADPRDNDDKALTNYVLDSVLQSGEHTIAVRVQGTMFRPQGAWWVTGKVFNFSIVDSGLVFSCIENTFGFFHGYNRGEDPPISVMSEELVDKRFRKREVYKTPEHILRLCGFRNPVTDDASQFNWIELRQVARCITERAGAKESFRAMYAPTFVERGGK